MVYNLNVFTKLSIFYFTGIEYSRVLCFPCFFHIDIDVALTLLWHYYCDFLQIIVLCCCSLFVSVDPRVKVIDFFHKNNFITLST